MRFRKELMGSRWIIKDKESIPHLTSVKTRIIDSAMSFEFPVEIDSVKLEVIKTKIAQNIIEK